jgi:hypothetical protein
LSRGQNRIKEQAAKGTHDKVKELINALAVTGDALRVLEAPCGFGGMATFLNSRNYKVTALDIIPPEKLDSNICTLKHDLNELLPFEDREFNEEVQHLEGLAFSWYSRWLWEKDTGILALRNGTG